MNQKKPAVYSALLSLLLLALPAFVQAQALVSGTVTDDNNAPLIGVSIQVKGTQSGTQSNEKGAFSLKAANQSVLVFSILGYNTREVTVTPQQSWRIVLTTTAQSLKDIVVVGYGTQKRSDVTGSVASIKGADITNRPVTNVLDALSAKVPGLSIANNSGRPGGEMRVAIRGISSINATNNPLYVIDGLVGGDIQMINPSDIESIDVLKDASATAIYGSRAANGVIIVTTRRPRIGDLTLSYDGSLSVGTIARATPMLDANGYMEYVKRAWEYDPVRGAFPKDKLATWYPDLFNADGTPKYNTNWQREATRTALSNRHAIALTSGTEKARQGLYLGYQNEQGLLLNTYYKKYSIRYTSEVNVKPWLTAGGSLTYNATKKNQVDDYAVGAMTATRTLAGMIPILPVRYPNGDHSTMEDFGFGFNVDGSPYKSGIYTAENPVRLLNELVYVRNAYQALADLYATIKINQDLEFKTTFGAWITDNKNDLYIGKDLLDIGVPSSGYANSAYDKTTYWQSESFLTYKKTFAGKHRFNAVLGASWSENRAEGFNAEASGFATDYYQYYNLSAGSIKGTPGSFFRNERLNSYYARVNYAYNDKYLLTITGRYDGSSKFGNSNKYAFFPSAAIGWNVAKESFLANNPHISNLKLRGSYGVTGNSGINPYSSLSSLNNYTIYLNDQRLTGTAQGIVPNPGLKWEQTAQANVGIDLGLFNNRISFTADYYHKKTTNLLLERPISIVSGYSSVSDNIGSVQNKGVEMAISGIVIDKRDWNWTVGSTFSSNRNKVLALGRNNEDIFPGTQLPGGLRYTILRVGGSVGDLFGYTRLGTWSTKEAAEAAQYGAKPGDIKRLDANGDYKYDIKDCSVPGNMFPKYEMSFNTQLRYRNWDLSADIQIVQGNKVINASAFELEDRQHYLSSYASLLADAWTPQHQNTMIPAIRYITDNKGSDYPSGYMDSHWMEDGSFIRGKNLTIGYVMPGNLLSAIGINRVRIYANAQNFFLITQYRGYDPEASSLSGPFTQGADYFGYPKPRTYTLGLNVTF